MTPLVNGIGIIALPRNIDYQKNYLMLCTCFYMSGDVDIVNSNGIRSWAVGESKCDLPCICS